MKNKKDLINAISQVQHPAIAFSLLDLGIVKDIELKENVVSINFAFPFPNIPIANQLVNSIAQPVQELGFEFKHEILLMTEEEKAKFMQMEAAGWKS